MQREVEFIVKAISYHSFQINDIEFLAVAKVVERTYYNRIGGCEFKARPQKLRRKFITLI